MYFKQTIKALLWSTLLLCTATGLAKNRATDRSRFMQQRGTEFYLDGKPFYEISFNKFDLFWQLLYAEFGNTDNHQLSFICENAEEDGNRALDELNAMGFKTFRTFGNEHSAKIYQKPENHARYYAVIDHMLDMCDRHDLRVVFSLGVATFITPDETLYDLVVDRNSKSWRFMTDYLRTIVKRYKNRATIAMWENQNELLLLADIGGRERMRDGARVPTANEVAKFHAEVATIIRSIDKRHLITTGDAFRTSQWHLNRYCEHGEPVGEWDTDTWKELTEMVSTVQAGVDIYGLHAYYEGKEGFGMVRDEHTGDLRRMTLKDWREEAARFHSPFYLGEWGALARAKSDTVFYAKNPDWFTSFVDDKEHATPIMQEIMNQVVDAGIQLTHFWAYSSDRICDTGHPRRMDITIGRNPELVKIVCEANRRLQMAHMGFTYMK